MSQTIRLHRSRALPDWISAQTAEQLRDALRAALHGDGFSPTLSGAIGRSCADARARGVRSEELIVALKGLWFGMPEVAGLAHGGRGHELLERVVTTAIEEYYRT